MTWHGRSFSFSVGDNMTNEEIVSKIQQGDDVKHQMAVLYEQNRKLILKIIQPFTNMCDEEDLMQEAYISLHHAAQRYDPASGVLFMSYAGRMIYGEVLRYIHNNCRLKRVPVHLWSDVGIVKKFVEAYTMEHGEGPSDEQIKAQTGLSDSRLKDSMQIIKEASMASLDSPLPDHPDTLLRDMIPDSRDMEAEICEQICIDEDCRKLWKAVDQLPERQSDIIRRRYREGQTLTSMAAEMGVTCQRVQQLEKSGLKRMKEDSIIQQIADDFGVMSIAYKGSFKTFIRSGSSSTEAAALKHLDLIERYYGQYSEKVRSDPAPVRTDPVRQKDTVEELEKAYAEKLARLQQIDAEMQKKMQEL